MGLVFAHCLLLEAETPGKREDVISGGAGNKQSRHHHHHLFSLSIRGEEGRGGGDAPFAAHVLPMSVYLFFCGRWCPNDDVTSVPSVCLSLSFPLSDCDCLSHVQQKEEEE